MGVGGRVARRDNVGSWRGEGEMVRVPMIPAHDSDGYVRLLYVRHDLVVPRARWSREWQPTEAKAREGSPYRRRGRGARKAWLGRTDNGCSFSCR